MRTLPKSALALAALAALGSCALPWQAPQTVETASGSGSSGAVSAEARPKTVEEFSARELSGAILEAAPAPQAESGSATTAMPAATGASSDAASASERLRAAREAHRKNLFSAFVRRGDWYALKDDRETALKAYLVAFSRANASAQKKSDLAAKVADLYFGIKRFPEAVEFYKKAEAVPAASALNFALALSYVDDAEKVSLLPGLALTDDQKKYFSISYGCREGAGRCADAVRAYAGTGELASNLKASLADFEALAAEDTAYRDALLAAAFLKNRDYAASAAVADDVLKRRPDYYPVLKLAGRAWWEMGRYDEAIKALQRYYRANAQDVEAAYLVGLCYAGKQDWETASAFFNRAVIGGYKPKVDAERQLSYAYAMMGAHDNLWQVLGYLLKDADAGENDFSAAAWLALEGDNPRLAAQWAQEGVVKFPSSGWMGALAARAYRTLGDQPAREAAVSAAVLADHDNPLALLERGILLADKGDVAGKADFLKVTELDPEGTFGTDAQARLDTWAGAATSGATPAGTAFSGATAAPDTLSGATRPATQLP